MNNLNENKTDETSQPIFNEPLLRYVKDDLYDIITTIDRVHGYFETIGKEGTKLERFYDTLEIAKENVEEVLDEIRDDEEKVEGLIKSIAD